MDEPRNTRRNLVVVAAAVALFVSAGGVVALAQGGEGEVFTGCLNQNSGVLKKVAIGSEPAKPCNGQEAQITWDRAGPAFEGRIAELEERVAELEEPFGTLDLFVDCDAGETIGAALGEADTHLGQVNITISGVCEEDVRISRDDVSLSGVNRSDGIRGSSPDEGGVDVNGARRVSLSNMTISGGQSGISVAQGEVGVSGITVRDTSHDGIFAQIGSELNVDDSLIVENTGSGIAAQTESIIVLHNSEVSHNGGLGVGAGGGTISVNNSEIVDNGAGAAVGEGGHLDLGDSLVANNRFGGVSAIGGHLGMSGETRIIDNLGHLGGLFVGTGSSVYIGTGPVVVEGNSGNGIQVWGGSSLRADELIVRDNGGNGISVQDLSTVNLGYQIQVVDNGGWGITCDGPPAVTVLGGQALFNPSEVDLTGNAFGDTNCQ